MTSSLLTYLLLGLCALLFASSFFLSSKRAPPALQKFARFSTAAQLVAMLGAYMVLRPGGSSDFGSLSTKAKQEQRLLFLSFHSNH